LKVIHVKMLREDKVPTSEEQLVRAAREGDRTAFSALVKRLEPRVAATVIGMLGDTPEAEDVGQETFIRFYKALDSYRGESSVSTYVTRIAINLSLNELKRRKRRFSLFSNTADDDIELVVDEKTGGPHFEDGEMIQSALSKLSPGYRAVIVLRLLDGLTTEETARMLNIPIGTVLSRLARAQKKMRDILKPYFGEKS